MEMVVGGLLDTGGTVELFEAVEVYAVGGSVLCVFLLGRCVGLKALQGVLESLVVALFMSSFAASTHSDIAVEQLLVVHPYQVASPVPRIPCLGSCVAVSASLFGRDICSVKCLAAEQCLEDDGIVHLTVSRGFFKSAEGLAGFGDPASNLVVDSSVAAKRAAKIGDVAHVFERGAFDVYTGSILISSGWR
ncbi:unnamed protein product [Dibothriocephalus latus]|uniref:Uncharacterized protein n=1 Tax=Dibothriocephalus latus TaxID=60516 RepID=A0A3P7LVQ3_DIBLA|nr:unnamed protein product [Dibothriocephalus latus]